MAPIVTFTWGKEAMAELLAECGAIALKYYDRPPTDYKRDRSVVTQADKDIEQHLARVFDVPRERSYLIGEETVEHHDERYLSEALAERAWIVDPIDGTALYANHLPCWGVSVGYSEAGVLKEGAVYFPLTDELFITEAGKLFYGPRRATVPIQGARRPYSVGGIFAITQEIARFTGFEVPNPVYAGGSAVYPLTELLLGRFLGYVGQLNLWDIAGSIPLLLNGGFTLELEDGTPVGGTIDPSIYVLDAGDPKRWKFRSMLLCSATAQTLDVMRGGLRDAKERRR